jgi:hypothetical protein
VNNIVVGSSPNATAIANATANNPQSLLPDCIKNTIINPA